MRHEIFWTRLVAVENHLHGPSFDFHMCFDTLLRHIAATGMAVDEEGAWFMDERGSVCIIDYSYINLDWTRICESRLH